MLTIVCRLLVVYIYIYFVMKKDKKLIDFGLKVKLERKKQGLSQEQLADLANLHRTYIGMIERAEKNITLLNMHKIAQALNLNLKDLI